MHVRDGLCADCQIRIWYLSNTKLGKIKSSSCTPNSTDSWLMNMSDGFKKHQFGQLEEECHIDFMDLCLYLRFLFFLSQQNLKRVNADVSTLSSDYREQTLLMISSGAVSKTTPLWAISCCCFLYLCQTGIYKAIYRYTIPLGLRLEQSSWLRVKKWVRNNISSFLGFSDSLLFSLRTTNLQWGWSLS